MTGLIVGRREAVQITGPEAGIFLQGQLSQDIEAIEVGCNAWSLLLSPRGKLIAWVRVSRTGTDRFVLDTDSGWADEVQKRLSRFLLRTDAEVTQCDWQSVTILSQACDNQQGRDGVRVANLTLRPGAASLIASERWGELVIEDLFGPRIEAIVEGASPPFEYQEQPPGTIERLNAWRIVAGVPKMGTELTEGMIPAEALIVDRSVSFTKGCYTGQEMVARVDSRGNNVPRKLVGVILDSESKKPEPGLRMPVSGASSGAASKSGAVVITSAEYSERFGAVICLGFAGRSVKVGDRVEATDPTVAGEPGACSGHVAALPLSGRALSGTAASEGDSG